MSAELTTLQAAHFRLVSHPSTGYCAIVPHVLCPESMVGPESGAKRVHVVIVLDCSGSMRGGSHPRRLAQEAMVKRLYRELPEGTEVSLIAIKADAEVIFKHQLKTSDSGAMFDEVVDNSSSGESTDFYGAFREADVVIKGSTVPTSSTALIICSDGEDTKSSARGQTPDQILKPLIDALARDTTGIPSGAFVCFNDPANSHEQVHIGNVLSLGQRLKQAVFKVADGPVNPAVVETVVSGLLGIIPSHDAMHVYREALSPVGNQIKRQFRDGKEAVFLGTISPGDYKKGQPFFERLDDVKEHPHLRLLFLKGDSRYELSGALVEASDIEADDILYAAAKNSFDYQVSHSSLPNDASRAEIESNVIPMIHSLMTGPRTDAFLGEVWAYLTQPVRTPHSAATGTVSKAMQLVGDMPPLTEADVTSPGSEISSICFKASKKSITLSIPPQTSVLQTKQILQAKLGIPVDQIKIIVRGQVLQNEGNLVDAAKESVINFVETPLHVVERERAAQEAAARVSALSDGWVSDPVCPKTISVILTGGETLAIEVLPTTAVAELLGEIKRLKGLTDAFLISLHDRHGGPALPEESRVSSIPEALTVGFFCEIMPKPAFSSDYYFSVSLDCGKNHPEKIILRISGEDEPTIARVKTVIGEKLTEKGFRVTNALHEIEIVISGQRIADNALPLNRVPGLQVASSIYAVHHCPLVAPEETPLVLITRDGMLESYHDTDGSSSTLSVVTAGGEIVQIETRRDTTLLRLLMGIMGLSSAKDVPFDTILRTITARTSVELDLNQTLSELRIGPNAMLFLQGNHRLAAAREFSDPSSLSGPSGFELPRGATGRVLALTDETPAQPGAGAGAGTGAGSGSTGGGGSGSARQALTVTFVAAFKEQYEASRGRLMSLWVTNFAATLTGPTDDQYKQIRTHVTSDPTCRTADIVRSILAKPDYAPLKPDFSPSV